jgi:ribose transport system ATP-binding protein
MVAGMALVPADRRAASGIASASVRENVSMPVLGRFFQAGFLRRSQEGRHVDSLLRTFDVKPPDSSLPLSSLSGGNQQKAILAKWFQTDPVILLLHEPTQGVDVGSRKTIFKQIRNAASSGTAILLVSTEYADLANLCDRVLVMRNGRQVAELSGGALSEQTIIAQCMMNEGTRSPMQLEPV